ncbi:hypothetical protein, partial [Prosthecobacter sp.]|uniref:hypothetical protein n=1 Tax=Prosthecobacter sp. TaxID=1965333 RepID=UPI0037835C7E
PPEGRFACYWWSAEHSGTAWAEREAEAREACTRSEAEIKWAREKAAAIHQELIEDANRRSAGQSCLSKTEHDTKEAEKERIYDACNTWKIGEGIRQRRIWIEDCEEWADGIIEQRGKRMENEGWKLADFSVNDLNSVECDGDEARARLEHAALWLPVYYEYARQSRNLLLWARMLNTMEEGDIMKPGEAAPLSSSLKKQLGGGWVSVLGWLCDHLGEDHPFSMMPQDRRLRVAVGAANATLTHIEINPDTYGIEDGGRLLCSVESRWAGRQLLRVAKLQEATTTRSIGVYDARIKERSSYEYRDGLDATVDESFIKPRDEAWTVGKSKIERRGNDDLKARNVDKNGSEVIVLKVNWNETNDRDIGDAMTRLCKSIRPTRWPECIEEAGNQKQRRDKALSVLIYWRMTASLAAPISSTLKEIELKQEIEGLRKELGRAVRDRDEATAWFQDITGEVAPPWWSAHVSNPK